MLVSVISFLLLCAAALLGGFSYRANSVAQPALFSQRIEFLSFGFATTRAVSQVNPAKNMPCAFV